MISTCEKYEKYQVWSRLSNTPVLFWDEDKNAYLVCWMDFVLPRRIAMMHAAKFYNGVNFGPSCAEIVKDDFIVDVPTLNDNYNKLSERLRQAGHKLGTFDAKQVMQWFDFRNALHEESEN